MNKVSFFIAVLFCLGLTGGRTSVDRDPEIEKMVGEISRENLEKYVNKLVGFHTRHNLSEQNDPERGIGAAWNWIKSEMEKSVPASNGRLEVKFEEYSAGGEGQRIATSTMLKNVVATLKGTDPNDDRVIVMSAHLDSRAETDGDAKSFAPGADDDGSGVAAMLELVRIMSSRRFPATIVFMALSGEEHGLYGSKYMAKKAKESNWNVVAVLNNDMIGRSGSDKTSLRRKARVRVFSEGVPSYETEQTAASRKAASGENDGRARQLARYVKETGERYVDRIDVTLVYRSDRFGRGGDHLPFSQEGYPAVRICEFDEEYSRQHKAPRIVDGVEIGDLPEHVDYEYVRKNAGINLAAIANLAIAPNEPANCEIDTSQSNDTAIRWLAPAKGVEPAGYYVVVRETFQPLWEKRIFVKGTEAVLPYSKDNYFFGVQSVDAAGHESVVVFPTPAKKK